MTTGTRLCLALAMLHTALGLEAQVVTQKPTVKVEYDRQRDFSLFTTYDWMKTQKPADNMANHVRITRAIQKELEALDLSPDVTKPGVRIQYRVETRKKIEAASTQKESVWDRTNLTTDFIFERQNLGTLTIEMFDAETNALVWRASTTQKLGTPDKAEKIINEAVKRLFTKYPKKEE
jgi:hypothetical protein